MRPNITISIPEPYLTLEVFMERFNLPKQTVRDMIKDGRLPVRKKSASMKKGTVFINMLALYVEASEGCNISFQPNQQG